MPNSSIALARRRSAQLAAKAITTEPEVQVVDSKLLKARESFSYFCELMGK